MNPSLSKARRRPFLAPLWIAVASAVFAALAAFGAWRAATTTTFIVLRHAEKQLGTIEDPPLAAAGELRAVRLAQMFGERRGAGGIEAIYVSDTRRARQTAAPLAARLRLNPIEIPRGDPRDTIRAATREHRGGAVLIVGHSNTVADIVRRISGRPVAALADDDYSTLYIVTVPTVGRASVLRMSY